jgi:DNA-binding NtrC family response regulator
MCHSPHVLIVEDHRGLHRAQKAFLEIGGATVHSAHNLPEAMDAYNRFSGILQAVVVDFGLPEGTDALPLLDAIEASGRPVHVVGMSACPESKNCLKQHRACSHVVEEKKYVLEHLCQKGILHFSFVV